MELEEADTGAGGGGGGGGVACPCLLIKPDIGCWTWLLSAL